MRNQSKSPIKTRREVSLTPEKNYQYPLAAVSNSIQTCEKVKIAIRIRPALNEELQEDFVQLVDKNTLKINRIGNTLMMKFSDILPQSAKQDDVSCMVQESIMSFLKGTNNTIFAYGQTGAGKTYTIIGNISENVQNLSNEKFYTQLTSQQRGILPRALQIVIDKIKERPSNDQCKLYLSFFEVYNEKIQDLFDLKKYKDNNGLDIRETKNGDVQIPDLSSVLINDISTAYEYLMIGLRNRVTGNTHYNSKSSRSHSIFQLTLQQVVQQGDEQLLVESQLKIVDLAGSEKYKIPADLTPEEKETHIQELTSINSSLSTLGHCISALIDRTRTHIPFRNSKLTRVLSDVLSGSGRISFIVCISPSLSSSAETFSTLQFANRAKRAVLDGRNLPSAKKQQTPKTTISAPIMVQETDEYQQLYKMFCREKAHKEELEETLRKRKHGDVLLEFSQLKAENRELKEQIKRLQISIRLPSESSQASITVSSLTADKIESTSPLPKQSSNSSSRLTPQRKNTSARHSAEPANHSLSLQDQSKRVRFADDILTEHLRQQLDYEDSMLENLAIFKELKSTENKDVNQKLLNFEQKFKNYFGDVPTKDKPVLENSKSINCKSNTHYNEELSKQTRSVPEPLRTPSIPKKKTDLNFNELNNQSNYDQEGRNFESIIRKVNDKKFNISSIVQDLKKEMSKAVNQLELLQQEDKEIVIIEKEESLQKKGGHSKENQSMTFQMNRYMQ